MIKLLVLLFILAAVCSCDATYTITFKDVPYCPVSDSAKARADSVPFVCRLPDGTVTK